MLDKYRNLPSKPGTGAVVRHAPKNASGEFPPPPVTAPARHAGDPVSKGNLLILSRGNEALFPRPGTFPSEWTINPAIVVVVVTNS